MSNIALLERPTAAAPSAAAPAATGRAAQLAPVRPLAAAPSPAASAAARVSASRAVPETVGTGRAALPAGTAPRGFALYVGLDEAAAAAAGVSLSELVAALRRTVTELVPAAETHATVALAPSGAGGRDVDVVRLALHEPAAVARTKPVEAEPARRATGVIVDISRKKVVLDGDSAALTYKEFELLQYLVLREGRTIERTELVESLWNTDDADAPGERTIDVHVRRLRSKLGRYEDIVRTVRGVGYRFDRHADVAIRYGAGAPSPDRF